MKRGLALALALTAAPAAAVEPPSAPDEAAPAPAIEAPTSSETAAPTSPKERYPRIAIVEANYEHVLKAGLANPRNQFQRELGVSVTNIQTRALAPFVFDRGYTVILTGIDYRQTRFSYSDWNFDLRPFRLERVHALRYQLIVRQKLWERWGFILQASPGLFTDFDDVGVDHFRVEGGGAVSYQWGPSHLLAVGLLYLSNFGEPQIVPFVTYTRLLEHWTIDLVLPSRVQVLWIPTPRFETGIAARLAGAQYRIGDPEAPIDELKFNTLTTSAVAQGRVVSDLWARFELGYTMLRRYEVFNRGQKAEVFEAERRPAFRIGLSYEPGP